MSQFKIVLMNQSSEIEEAKRDLGPIDFWLARMGSLKEQAEISPSAVAIF